MRLINNKTVIVILIAFAAIIGAWNWRIADPQLLRAVRDLTFDTYQRIKPREPLGQPIRVIDIDEVLHRRIWPVAMAAHHHRAGHRPLA